MLQGTCLINKYFWLRTAASTNLPSAVSVEDSGSDKLDPGQPKRTTDMSLQQPMSSPLLYAQQQQHNTRQWLSKVVIGWNVIIPI